MKLNLIATACLTIAMSAQAQTTVPSAQERARATGQVVMGVRESGGAMSYMVSEGRYAGFHVELCQRIIADMEKQVGRKIEVKYQLVTGQNRIPLLQNGTIDIECGVTTNNATRQKDVSFLNTTFVEEVRIAVKANSGITSIAQLANRTVATTTGTTAVQHLRRHERSAGINFNEVFGKDAADSFLMLESGRADAFITDAQVLAGNIATSRTPGDFAIVGEVLNVEPIAIMVRKDDAAFKAAGNGVIAGMVRSGEMLQLWNKWFNQPIPPRSVNLRLPVSESTRQAWANLNDKPMEDYVKK